MCRSPDPRMPAGILLRPTADLRRLGESPDDREADGLAKWVRVRHGVVVRRDVWAGLDSTQRHGAFVRSTAMQMRAAEHLVFSHTSAAAVWGLPRITPWPHHASVTSDRPTARSSGLVKRHIGAVEQRVTLGGLTVTSVARTVIDLARSEELPDAVAAADFALHHELCRREDLVAELECVPAGARGRARAALVVDFADAGAMSVGESMSRVQMFRLNIPRPSLQVRVDDADGLVGYCDFGWEGVMGEFDGRFKYGLTEDVGREQVADVLWREKRREDRIRARGHRMARWVWADAARPRRMVEILGAQGIHPTPRNTWFDAA
ncbi:hypothetical protein [Knoellia flava]|nr:hypothetical protein [Knoellia flava]